MSAADYYLCDVCGGKAFCDNDVDWGYWRDQGAVIAAICKSCAKKYSVAIMSPAGVCYRSSCPTGPEAFGGEDEARIAGSVQFLNKAYAMAHAGGGGPEPAADGPKTITIHYPTEGADDCWGENSWQRLRGQALLEALDWVISEGNGFPESTARHAHWCSRAYQACDAARESLLSPDSDTLQDDLAAILRAVGLSDAARPYSPHEVVQRDLLPRLAKVFDNTSLVSRYQLDLQFHGPDNLEGIWRAYQSTRVTLVGDLVEGWGRTPGAAIENAVAAIFATTSPASPWLPNVDEPEGEALEDLCMRLDKWRLYGCADSAPQAAEAIRNLLVGRTKMRRRFDEMYECAQKYGGSLQRLAEMLRSSVSLASFDGLRAGDDVMAGLEAALPRLIERANREPVAWLVTHDDGYEVVTWTPEGVANAKAAGCKLIPLVPQ